MRLKERYKINKTAKVGEELVCPSCCETFIKESYQQAFCKTKPKTKCKDRYWNTVTPTKRNNTTRISPANRRYYENHIENREFKVSDYDDGIDYLLECGSR